MAARTEECTVPIPEYGDFSRSGWESWWPESVNDVAFVVEDDMEVSPLFYRYLKRLLGVYYFNASNFNPSVYGVSLSTAVLHCGLQQWPQCTLISRLKDTFSSFDRIKPPLHTSLSTPPHRTPPSHPPSQTPSSGFSSGLNVLQQWSECVRPAGPLPLPARVTHPSPLLSASVFLPCLFPPQPPLPCLPSSPGFNSGLNVYDHPDPFLYQLVGTWGQFLLPAPWKQFRLWYDMRRYNSTREPSLDGLKTTVWFKNKGNRLWTPWIIKWAYAKGMFNLYPSPPGNLSLSISHREKGSNMPKNPGGRCRPFDPPGSWLPPWLLRLHLLRLAQQEGRQGGVQLALQPEGRQEGCSRRGGCSMGAVDQGVVGSASCRCSGGWSGMIYVSRQLRWLPPAKTLEEFHSC
ncbi:unnamed protein product [Closterium sp. NIES-65]|nr:unnamed protein product [Closterium sp. NIES-65]